MRKILTFIILALSMLVSCICNGQDVRFVVDDTVFKPNQVQLIGRFINDSDEAVCIKEVEGTVQVLKKGKPFAKIIGTHKNLYWTWKSKPLVLGGKTKKNYTLNFSPNNSKYKGDLSVIFNSTTTYSKVANKGTERDNPLSEENKYYQHIGTDGRMYNFIYEGPDLLLKDASTSRLIKRFSPTVSEYPDSYLRFAINPIYIPKAGKSFLIISAFRHGAIWSLGTWIVSPEGGDCLTYTSLDALRKAGYNLTGTPYITWETKNGDIHLYASHKYMPPGGEYMYQMKWAQDMHVRMFWDSKANWFGMESL